MATKQVTSLRMEKKFKKTPAGEIPVEWEAIQIEDVADVYGGGTPDRKNPQYWDGSILWATPTDVTKNSGTTISSTKEGITEAGMKNSAATLMPAGSILMTSRATLGYSVINTVPMTTNQGFANFICKAKIHNFFLLYMLQSKADALQRLGAGSTFLEIPKSAIRKLLIPVPPLPEQQKIAEILSSVDEAIEKTDAVIEKTKQLKKGLMQKLLTRGVGHKKFKKTELGELPAGWYVVTIESIVAEKPYAIVDGPFGSNLKTIHYRTEGIPVIQSGYVTSGKFVADSYVYVDKELFEEQKRSAVVPRDIVMAKIGAQSGTSAMLPDNHPVGIIAGNCLKISTNSKKCRTKYLLNLLHYYYDNGRINKLKTETAQPAITLKSLRKFTIPLPPPNEQDEIISILDTQNTEITSEEFYHEKLMQTKKSLMQVLLTGKVRVKI